MSDESATTTISVRLSPQLKAQLQAIATINGTTVSSEAEKALRAHVQKAANPEALELLRRRLREETKRRMAEQLKAIEALEKGTG